jgi:hypothetical protein
VKIVADESVDRQIVAQLRVSGHEVAYVAELDPGIPDEMVLSRSREANALLITADKDLASWFSVSVWSTLVYCFFASPA